MSEKPNQLPVDVKNATQNQPQTVSSGQAADNAVSDTVTGVNARWSDNKFQAVFVSSPLSWQRWRAQLWQL